MGRVGKGEGREAVRERYPDPSAINAWIIQLRWAYVDQPTKRELHGFPWFMKENRGKKNAGKEAIAWKWKGRMENRGRHKWPGKDKWAGGMKRGKVGRFWE